MKAAGYTLLCAVALATAAGPAAAAPWQMTALSSATYNSGGTDVPYAMAADASGNIYVTGSVDYTVDTPVKADWLSLKYSKGLVQGAGITYTNGRSGNSPAGIALDSQGNILVAGMEANIDPVHAQDYLLLKYSPGFAAQIASAAYDGGLNDMATAVVTDAQDNVYVTGYSNDGTTNNFYTIKYGPGLTRISSAVYDSGYPDQANAATMAGDYLIVAGTTKQGGTSNNITVVRYDTDLNDVGEASFDTGGNDTAVGVTTDPSGDIIVAGQTSAANPDFLVLKYDSLLHLISSATFDSGLVDRPTAVAADSAGNIIMTGFIGPYVTADFLTVKFDNSLNLISTATYDGGGTDKANTVAVDQEDNVIVAGQSYTASDDFFLVKYNASPKLTEVSPIYIGETANVAFKGYGLISGSSVAFADPSISTGIISSVLSNQITLPVTPAASVQLGITTVTVIAPNGEEAADYTHARTYLRTTVAAGASASITAMTKAGQVSVTIPAGTFSQQELVTLYTVAPDASGRQIGEAVYLAVSPAAAPQQNISVTLHYLDSDLGSNTEGALKFGYYDSDANAWQTLNTALNTSANTVSAVTRAVNTRYSVVNPGTGGGGGGTVPGGMGGAKVYPNPYRPGSGGDYDSPTLGDGIVFAGLGAGQSVKVTITDLAGRLVYQKSAAAGSDGKWLWDTKTSSGGKAATGVYIYIIKGAGEPLKGKLAIIR